MFEWILNGGGVPIVVGGYGKLGVGFNGSGSFGSRVGITADGTTLASSNGTVVRLFNLTHGEYLEGVSVAASNVDAVAFSGSGGEKMFTFSAAVGCRIYANVDGTYQLKQTIHNRCAEGAVSKDGSVLLLGSGESIEVYELGVGGVYETRGVLPLPNGAISYRMAISDDLSTIVGGSGKSSASVFSRDTEGNYVYVAGWYVGDWFGYSVALSADGSSVLVARYGSNVILYSRQPDNSYLKTFIFNTPGSDCAITPDGKRVVIGNHAAGEKVTVWDNVGSGWNKSATIEPGSNSVYDLAMSGDGKYLIVGDYQGKNIFPYVYNG